MFDAWHADVLSKCLLCQLSAINSFSMGINYWFCLEDLNFPECSVWIEFLNFNNLHMWSLTCRAPKVKHESCLKIDKIENGENIQVPEDIRIKQQFSLWYTIHCLNIKLNVKNSFILHFFFYKLINYRSKFYDLFTRVPLNIYKNHLKCYRTNWKAKKSLKNYFFSIYQFIELVQKLVLKNCFYR